MVKPLLKQNVEVGKRHDVYVAFHCCGAIGPIIADLIEIGVDVLNPIQCNCPGMTPLELKREYGKDLTFMGGVDTQVVLPHGTVDQVRKATAELLKGMTTDGGGYILAASHTVPPETPNENIFAMYREAGITKEAIFDNAANIRKTLRQL
jgi:uroporphyrinogen decarboxylase